MTEREINQIRGIIQETIKTTVNGKIDAISTKLDEHIDAHAKDQKAMKPMIDSFDNWSGFKQILFTIFFPILGVLGAFGGIGEVFNLFSHK